jgi:hypothetical protein
MKTTNIKNMIFREMDGTLSEKEKILLKTELENSEELRKFQREITSVRDRVKKSAESSFKPFFEERVMSRLARISDAEAGLSGFAVALVFSSKRFVYAAMIILGLLISYNISSGNNHSISNLLGSSSEASIEYAFSPLIELTGSSK